MKETRFNFSKTFHLDISPKRVCYGYVDDCLAIFSEKSSD